MAAAALCFTLPVELFFNLLWVALACSTSLAWVMWRRRSRWREAPTLLRGLTVVVCILALLFPVISISDDLSQTPGLAEGLRIQDILKAPDLRSVAPVAAIAVLLTLLQPERRAIPGRVSFEAVVGYRELFRTPAIENRPPPQLA
jgi:uncharacterized iron-regulated membrane protein